MHTQDVVVVGAGLAGLVAGVTAARAGASVTVLERKSVAGGRGTTDLLSGFAFNQGAHAVSKAGLAFGILERLGVTPAGANSHSTGKALFGGELEALPMSPRAIATTALLSARGRLSLAKAFASLQFSNSARLADISFATWVDEASSDPLVRLTLHAFGRLSSYANAPDLVSADAIVAQLQVANKGVLYLDGGWQQLIDGLLDSLLAAKASLVANVTVADISSGTGGRWLVRSGDQVWDAGSVIVAGLGPLPAARILGLSSDVFAHSGPAVEAAVLDLSLPDETAERFVLGIDEPTYFSLHGPPAEMAPNGCAAAVAMKYLPIGVETDRQQDRNDLDQIASLAGAPQTGNRRFLRRMTVAHGLPLASQGGLAGRPAVDVEGFDGVFLAGDWVGPTGLLLDASLASADAAANRAIAFSGRRASGGVD